MRVNLRTIARVGHHYIHRAELYNVSLDEAVKDKSSHHFDNILRNILLMFEGTGTSIRSTRHWKSSSR